MIIKYFFPQVSSKRIQSLESKAKSSHSIHLFKINSIKFSNLQSFISTAKSINDYLQNI